MFCRDDDPGVLLFFKGGPEMVWSHGENRGDITLTEVRGVARV